MYMYMHYMKHLVQAHLSVGKDDLAIRKQRDLEGERPIYTGGTCKADEHRGVHSACIISSLST